MISAVNTSPFKLSMLRKTNIWYSVIDGNWNNPAVWISNGKRVHNYPQNGDVVYINHNITVNQNTTVKNIYLNNPNVSLNFSTGNLILTVNGDFQCSGTLDQSAGANTIVLNGNNNFLANFTPGTSSTFTYGYYGDKSILPLNYRNLNILNGFTSNLSANLTLSGNLAVGSLGYLSIINTNGFDITSNGASNFANTTINSNNNINWVGNCVCYGLTINGTASITCSAGLYFNSLYSFWNNSSINFITNSQSLNCAAGFGPTIANVLITGDITITVGPSGGGALKILNSCNGTTSGSTLLNTGNIQFSFSNLPMTTGIYDPTTTGATTIYLLSSNFTLPYSNYYNLVLNSAASSTTSPGNNLNVINNLQVSNVLSLGNYNLSVGGTTSISNGSLTKTGTGVILFTGLLTFGQGSITLTGNPIVECRGGIAVSVTSSYNWGTGGISFTTNNQTISGTPPLNLNTNLLVADGITVTNSNANLTITGQLNGASTASVFVNNGSVNYQFATTPMLTGKLYCNQTTNTWIYGLSGNQDIAVPSDAVPGYQNLTLRGSGAKKLLGSISVKGTYTLVSPATLNNNGFSLSNP